MTLHPVPIRLREAKRCTAMHHRHNAPPRGGLWAIGASDGDGVLHGVVIVGRPTARASDNGITAEVTRCATDGTHNAPGPWDTSASSPTPAPTNPDQVCAPPGGTSSRNGHPDPHGPA